MTRQQASEWPRISCVMPTYGRPVYVNQAVKMFLDQDYPADRCELIILNDCQGQSFQLGDEVAESVRVINRSRRYATLGAKRNACIERAAGDLIAVWDDDDLYLPWRLRYSVEQMRHHQTAYYRASTFWSYWGGERLHENWATRAWISHSLGLFEKELSRQAGGYPEMDTGEDTEFYNRTRQTLGEDPDVWVTYPIDAADRYYILRGLSRYRHMSFGGSIGDLDIQPGVHVVEPAEIDDPVLKDVFSRLVAGRNHFTAECFQLRTPSSHSAGAEDLVRSTKCRAICSRCPQLMKATDATLQCNLLGREPIAWRNARCKLRKW